MLRRSAAEMGVAQFAAACKVALPVAQESLDRLLEAGLLEAGLLEAGLVERLRASRSRKYIAYRSVATEVLFAWNPELPEQRAAVEDFHLAMRVTSRLILDRHLASDSSSKPRACFFGYASVMLTPQEVDTVSRLLRAACEVLDEADMRAEARARGDYEGEIGANGELPYHLAVECRPLGYPEPPIPHFELWDDRSVPRELDRASRAASHVLTSRELEIGRLLAAGKSRPDIAEALKLTPNTVATVCKRIHKKLGIHTRAELTARLRGV